MPLWVDMTLGLTSNPTAITGIMSRPDSGEHRCRYVQPWGD